MDLNFNYLLYKVIYFYVIYGLDFNKLIINLVIKFWYIRGIVKYGYCKYSNNEFIFIEKFFVIFYIFW